VADGVALAVTESAIRGKNIFGTSESLGSFFGAAVTTETTPSEFKFAIDLTSAV
jgi:hypothetical protein